MRIVKEFNATTVTVAVAVTDSPSELVTVKVYVVLSKGLTDTRLLEVYSPIALSILPVPSVMKVAVKSTLSPAIMVVDVAVKLSMIDGTTVMVTNDVTAILPALLVTVKRYVVVVVGLTDIAVPEVTSPIPLLMTPVPPTNSTVRLVLLPSAMVVDAALKLEMPGSDAGALPPLLHALIKININSENIMLMENLMR